MAVVVPAADRGTLEPTLHSLREAVREASQYQIAVGVIVVDHPGAAAADWILDAFPEFASITWPASWHRARAVTATVQRMVHWWGADSVLVLEASTTVAPAVLATVHHTVHRFEATGIFCLRPGPAPAGGTAAAVEARELAGLDAPLETLAALRGRAGAPVVLRSDLLDAVGSLDPAYTTGLALADLVRRAGLRGWASAALTVPISTGGVPSRTGSAADLLRDDLDFIATDPALPVAGIMRAARARLHCGAEHPRTVAAALARVLWRLPRLVRRRCEHRAIALEAAVQAGRVPAPHGWRSRPWPIGWERDV
ncbi:hypothetical protein [Glycomyces sp. MUSA5-2]|uniref:hypothetical protein n=1 Tax=Glycomyces sp. MUSA5-2 TaxID=2053002 RepID=UPI003009732E